MSNEVQQLKFAKFMKKHGRSGITNHALARQGFLRYSHYIKQCRDEYGMSISSERQYLPNGRATNVWKYYYTEEKKTPWWKLKRVK